MMSWQTAALAIPAQLQDQAFEFLGVLHWRLPLRNWATVGTSTISSEPATSMVRDHTAASVVPRQGGFAEHHRKAEQIRPECWNELEAIFDSGRL